MKNYKHLVTEMKLSLQYHDSLNPKLWNDFKLDPEVRLKLLQFAEAWRQFAKIPNEAVHDVYMLGGNTNYNYTEMSDIDVHLVVDKCKIACDNPLLDDYLQDKKQMWTMSHDVKVKGYAIEPYAQDINDTAAKKDQGVFSLMRNEWVTKPHFVGDDMLKNPYLKKKVRFYMKMIDDMIKSKASDEAFGNLREKLRLMRGSAIAKGGEFSFENLVFKELRNRGYLDKMSKYIKSRQDQSLSLD